MSFSQGLKFIETIMPTFEYATAIQRLILQDLQAAGLDQPHELADPDNVDMVAHQLSKLFDHPECYSGYVRGDHLVACVKQGEWLVGDELPFATGHQAFVLRAHRALHLSQGTGQWGVFGLVASNSLEPHEREMVLSNLLQRTFADPRVGEPRTVNVVLYENDPILRLALSHGFVPVGRPAEAAGAPGLIQQRYQRPASY